MAAVAYIQGLNAVGGSKGGANATTAMQRQLQTRLGPACCIAARHSLARKRARRGERHAATSARQVAPVRALARKERPRLAMAEPGASGARTHGDCTHGAERAKPMIHTLFKATQKLLAITLEI
jgi:hypothetical protein